MDWFLYDRDIRHERVNYLWEEVYLGPSETSLMEKPLEG